MMNNLWLNKMLKPINNYLLAPAASAIPDVQPESSAIPKSTGKYIPPALKRALGEDCFNCVVLYF